MEESQTRSLQIYGIIYTLGVCTMLPWNFFITANNYWQYKLRNTTAGEDWNAPDAPLTNMQVAFTPALVIISNLICFFFQFFTSAITRSVKEKARILGSLALSFITMGIILILSILNTDDFQEFFFWITLLVVALLNIGIAVLQASLYGMIGFFPSSFITALVSGQSLAGVVSSLSQIISLAIGQEDPITSGIIYFTLAEAFIAFSIFAYIALRKMRYYKVAVNADLKREEKRTSLKDYTTVFKKIFWMGFSLGLVLLITLSVFPAVSVYVTSSHSPSTWADVYFQPTITFLLFNIMDMTGRELPRWIRWPSHKGYLFHLVSACRVIFIPLILLCNGENKSFVTLFHKDVYYIIINLLFALSNGYFGALAMVYYPKLISSEETELAGTLMASLMGVGMTIGSCLSPAFVAVWSPRA